MIQNHVTPYVPCELVGTPLYYGTWNMENLFFWLLQGQQPFESIPRLMCALPRLAPQAVVDRIMTSCHVGVMTRLQNEATYNVLGIRCPPHQCDLVLKVEIMKLNDGNFYNTAHAFFVHLHTQTILIAKMGSKCPKNTNHRLPFRNMLNWVLLKRRSILQHIADKCPVQVPSSK